MQHNGTIIAQVTYHLDVCVKPNIHPLFKKITDKGPLPCNINNVIGLISANNIPQEGITTSYSYNALKTVEAAMGVNEKTGQYNNDIHMMINCVSIATCMCKMTTNMLLTY